MKSYPPLDMQRILSKIMHKHTKEHCNKRCKLKLGVESLHCIKEPRIIQKHQQENDFFLLIFI